MTKRNFTKRLLAFLLGMGVLVPAIIRAQQQPPRHDKQQIPVRQNTSAAAGAPALQNPMAGDTTTGAQASGNASLAQGAGSRYSASPDYVIGPEDVLNIGVFNVPDLSQTVRVANDGTIPVLLLGQMRAAGLTAAQLQQKLQRRYGQTYLQHPIVSVYVSQFNAQQVAIIGAVSRPGMYPLLGNRTLIQMLSLAGFGNQTTSSPHGRTVLITRPGGFANLRLVDGMKLLAPDKLQINLGKLLYSGDSGLNIQIQPKDIISVSKAVVVYVTGRGVVKPGGFVLQNQNSLTVLQALAMAEGLSPNAKSKHSFIIHTQSDGSHTEISVNIAQIEKGKAPDPILQANDILWVPNSAQKAGFRQAAEAAVGTLSGLLIYGRL